jgi:lysophospholipase L1-like esterase
MLISVFGLSALPAACSGSGSTGPGNPGAAGAQAGALSSAGSGALSGGMSGVLGGSGGQAGAPTTNGGSGGALATGGVSGGGGAATGGTAGGSGSGGAMPSNVWTGTWSVAPHGCAGNFEQQTIRQIAHTSIGGTSARVRISNAESGGSLHIRDVHLAQRTTGSSIDAATDKAVLFNGQADVTIQKGMSAVSDSSDFMVKPLSDVALSFYVVSNGGATCHDGAFQTNYVVNGDLASSATLPGAQSKDSYYFALNLDVMNPAAEGAVVTLGASITAGHNSSSDANRRWPDDLAVRLASGNRVIGVLNQGLSAAGVMNAVARFERDVMAESNVKWVIFSDNPINDLGRPNPPSAQSEIDQIKGMIGKAHDKGVKFLCSTLTPFQPSEPGRTTINNFIHSADSGCDGIVDQDAATHDPAAPTQWLMKFNSGDSLHPNTEGLQAIADAVHFELFK